MISDKDQVELQLLLAKWLTKLREDKGLSQEALGTQIGKGQSDIAKMESGNKKVLVTDLLKWMKALDVPLESLEAGLGPLYKKLSGKKSLWNK